MDVSKYAALFLTESREHLSACNQLLLEWEREPAATGQVGGLFRAIHTIKGMAATMGYAGVADLAHRLENLLDALRQRTRRCRLPRCSSCSSARWTRWPPRSKARWPGAEPAADREARRGSRRGGGRSRQARGPDVARTPEAGRAAALEVGERVRPVQVALRRDAVMRGARAALVVRRAESLGVVSALRPPLGPVRQPGLRRPLCRSGWRAPRATSRSSRRSGARATSSRSGSRSRRGRAAGRGQGRQIRVDLGRLDTLMKQVGELVVAKNRLGVLATETDDPALVRGERPDRAARLRHAGGGDRRADDAGGRGVRAVSPAGARPRAATSASGSASTSKATRSSSTARSSTRSASRCCT